MIRVVLLAAALALAACRPSVQPSPADRAAADTARATLIAALIDAPPETLQVVKQVFPRGNGQTMLAMVAFTVDSIGKPMPETVTIVDFLGDSAFADAVCGAVRQMRFEPSPNGGPTLTMLPFMSFSSVNGPPPGFDTFYRQTRAKLENMSTVERRAFLLDKGCRRFK